MRIGIVALFIFLMSNPYIAAWSDVSGKLDEYIEKATEAWDFRGVVLIARGKNVLLESGYGLASEAFSQPNDISTTFFIGSITKQFTAALILKLREYGKLELDQTIDHFIQDYPQPAGSTITIHHLLTHTSGIPNYTEMLELIMQRTKFTTPEVIMGLFKDQMLDFKPGEKFAYSNSGYIVLGEIVERAAGQSYEAYLHHELLKPIGMLSSGYARRMVCLPGRAEGYTIDNAHRPVDATPISYSVLHSAGAMYSTVVDMMLWIRAIQKNTILSHESVELMFTDYGSGYGYGWHIDSLYGKIYYSHGGFLDGYQTTIELWPNEKLIVIVFSNEDQSPIRKMARGLASICFFGQPYVSPLKRQAVELTGVEMHDYDGVYQPGSGPEHLVAAHEDSLFISLPGRERDRLLPMAPDSFFMLSDNTITVSFFRDAFNKPVGYYLWDEGVSITAYKLETDWALRKVEVFQVQPIDSEVHGVVVGTYQLESCLAQGDSVLKVNITLEDNRLYACIDSFDRIELVPRSDFVFFHMTFDFELTFEVDEDSNVVACYLCMGNEKVRCVRIPVG